MTQDRTAPVQRRLAAILGADAAGYSRLMGDDEVATVRTLSTCRNLVADIIASHNGRVVDSPGDNILALHYKRESDLAHHRESLLMTGLP